MTPARIDVFISSTSIDLPDHRAAVRDAILSLGLFPSGMEHWPVGGENPVDLCRQKVESAEIYLGFYAHRYGWRPPGHDGKSITELEYDWAAEVLRDGKPIPRLCFIMDDEHPWPKKLMETDAEDALNRFKARVREHQVGFFTTPDDLKAQVLAALVPYASRSNTRVLTPYLRWLHDQSKKSGLLRVLNPRDASSDARPVTVEQVYTPLDTTQLVVKTPDEMMLANPDLKISDVQHLPETKDWIPLSVMEAANLLRRLVLLGDPGSGKSTFLGFLALCLSGALLDEDFDSEWMTRLRDQGWTHGAKLPIFVTLRDFAQDVGDAQEGSAALLFAHIERNLRKVELAAAYPPIKAALEEGRALVLLDGLDEVPAGRRELVRDAVAEFVERCHYSNRFIITCRILSYTNADWHIPGTTSQTIAPFDRDKMMHFIEAWYTALIALRDIDAETAKARISDLTGALTDAKLRTIAENPMLLTVMAIVHNHTGALPRESARLYDECVKLLMLRWRPHDARTLLDTLGVGVREDDLYRMLWEIAYDAHDKQADREGAADISESAILGIARKRLGDMGKAEAFCNYVEERAGLLIGRGEDSHGFKVYTFPHRTFQEYLAGCHLAAERFTRKLPEHARRGGSWREALLLATGHLIYNARDVATPLDAINTLIPERFTPQTDDDWRIVWLAGEMLVLVGLSNAENDEVGRDLIPRLRRLLAQLISGGHLPPVERAAAGRALSHLGDPRPGVGILYITPDNPDGTRYPSSDFIPSIAENALIIPDIDWVEIPGGEFIYQKDRRLILPAFHIARFPITYGQFQCFAEASDYDDNRWWQGMPDEQEGSLGINYRTRELREQYFMFDNHPRDNVAWYQVVAFCRWLSDKLGYTITLPTEEQWEKSARGTDGRIYPYEGDFDAAKGNTSETGIDRDSTVGTFPAGRSPYGVMDLCGNVWEMCLNKDDKPESVRVDGSGDWRVVRGGSWYDLQGDALATNRLGFHPVGRAHAVGFRVCRPPSL